MSDRATGLMQLVVGIALGWTAIYFFIAALRMKSAEVVILFLAAVVFSAVSVLSLTAS